MKKVFMLASALFLVSALAIPMAAPALACYPSTMLTILASPEQVGASEPVELTITETNDGEADLTDVSVELEPGGIVLYLADTDVGGNGNGDDILDIGETWTWTVTVYPTATTTYTATGHGTYGSTDYTYPRDPDEQKSVTVEVDNGGGEGFTPGFWKNHHDAWELTGYSPDEDYFDDIFGVGSHITLDEALRLKGGKCKALSRHAVAALLNAAHPHVSYEFSVADVIDMVHDAFIDGNCEDVKDVLEEQNELEGDISS